MSNGKRGGSDKGFEEALKEYYSPKEKRKEVSIIGGVPFFSWVFRKLAWLLRGGARGIWIVLFFILFVGFLIFLYNYFYGAQQGAVLWTHLKVGVEEAIPGFAKPAVTSIYSAVFRPQTLFTAYNFESDIEKNKDNQDLGLKITNLKQEGGDVYSGKPVFIRGIIKAQSLDRPLLASVDCFLEDYGGKARIDIPISEGGNKIKVYQDVPQTYSVGCYFESGVSISEEANLLVGESVVPRVAKEAKLSVNYEFITKASHNTYFLRRELAYSFLARGQDPFKYYNIVDPQLKSDRTVRSKATLGPINLGIGTYDSQPFSEGAPYFFGVSLSNNLAFDGYIKELNRLEVRLPPNMAVAGESEFGGEGSCDFYYTSGVDENGFKVYALKDEKLDEVNIRCSVEELKKNKISFADCISQFKSSFDYLCQFKIVEPIYGDSVYVDFIRAEADYVYETSRKIVINIIASPELLV